MKLASYRQNGKASYGMVCDSEIIDLPGVWPDGPKTLLELLQAGPTAMAHVRSLTASTSRVPLADVKLTAPLPNPPKVLALAGNYLAHIREFAPAGGEAPDNAHETTTPRVFLMPATTIADPNQVIDWPAYSEEIDHEVELAVVLGTQARNVTPTQVKECIAGYTIANDISARSVTHATGRVERGPKDDFFDWLHGKWADGFCPIGPYLVTADEIDDPTCLAISLTVNGDVRQQANTSLMIFNVYEIVAFCSRLMTLLPGDIIATGTPAGVGKASGKLLQSGDVMTCRIEGLGELSNTLGPRPTEFYRPLMD